jgi:hypothetical protein
MACCSSFPSPESEASRAFLAAGQLPESSALVSAVVVFVVLASSDLVMVQILLLGS